MSKTQFFELFIEFCAYYQILRLYDDASNVTLQLEVGGVLRRESDPRKEFPIEMEKGRDGKSTLVFKPVEEARKCLRV